MWRPEILAGFQIFQALFVLLETKADDAAIQKIALTHQVAVGFNESMRLDLLETHRLLEHFEVIALRDELISFLVGLGGKALS